LGVAIKKHKLEVAIEEDFCLLGLVTDEPDYKLCWLINRVMDMDFKKLEDLVLFHKKLDEDQVFSLFGFHDKESLLTYRIINNRADRGFFLDELINLDYLVHIQGEVITDNIKNFLVKVGKIETVRMCVPVDLKRIRHKERLLLW
jgi:hypothetical protein